MSRQDDIRNLITRYKRRLQILKEQKAMFGISTPPEITMEIEDIEEELQRLQAELSKSHVPHQSPNLPPNFVARAEINQCKKILLTPGKLRSSRLILKGMGGIGKTTLAIALAQEKEIIEHFKDGILWANLGPDSVVENWQLTWGYALNEDLRMFPSPANKATRLRELLAYKTCLLVIDDVSPKVDLTHLLVGGSDCCTVITTREDIVAQRIVGTVLDVKVLDQTTSLTLLGKWVDHDVSDNINAAQLVTLMGHHPLAIRLIGAQLWTGGDLADIAATFRLALREIKSKPTILRATDSVNPLGKEESLQLSFSISLEHLNNNDDQSRFKQLAAFAENEPFDREAAAAIWGESKRDQSVTEHLSTLVRHALVMCLENNSRPQYLLHPLLHSYAEEQLKKEEWGAEPYERHTNYYLQIAKDSVERWKLTERVFGQIKEAFKRVRQSEKPDYQLFEFVDGLSIFFERRGLWTEYLEWAKAGFDLARRLNDKETQARMFRHIGYTYYLMGNLDRALICNRFSLQTCRQLDDQLGILNSFKYLGHIYRDLKDFNSARHCYKQALIIAKKLERQTDIADCLGNLGHIYQILGDLQPALTHCQQALILNQELANEPGLAKDYNNIGLILYSQGFYEKALNNYRQSLALGYKLGNKISLAITLTNIATIHFEQQQYAEAEKRLAVAVSLFKTLGNMPQVEEVQKLLNLVRINRGNKPLPEMR